MTDSQEVGELDWDEIQKLAYGKLGLLPNEFWELTPSEFHLMLEGRVEDEERFWENLQYLAAWHAANIMNASGNLKKRIKNPEELLGKKNKETKRGPKYKTPEEKKKELEELKRKFGVS